MRRETLYLKWLVVAVVIVSQALAIRGAGGPFVYADELGYIAAARYFGPGYPDVQMLSAFYHFGYGLLLAPLTVIFTEPANFYRAATVFNSVLALSAVLVFHRVILLRFLEVTDRQAAAAAVAFGLAPPLLVQTSILWSETALVWIVTLVLAAVMALARRPSLSVAVLVGASSSFAYGIHPRGVAVTVAASGVMLLGLALRALPPRVVAVGLGTTTVGFVVVRLVNGMLADALYTEGSFAQSAGSILTDQILAEPGQWFGGLVGTAWYQLVASAGLMLFGIIFWWRHMSGIRIGHLSPMAAGALFLSATLGLSWLVGAVIAIADEPRIDQLFYGRYLDFVAPLALGFGVLEVLGRSRSFRWWAPAAVFATAAVGFVLSARRPEGFFEDRVVVRVNVPVVNALELVSGTWDPAVIGLAGAGLCAVVLACIRWRAEVGVSVLAALLLVGAHLTLDRTIHPASAASSGRTTLAGPVEDLADGGTVLVATPYEVWTLYGLQYWADDSQFALETHCPATAADVVVASPGDERYATWAIMAGDDGVGRQVLLDVSGASAGSRSVSVAVGDVIENENGGFTVETMFVNLDTERPFVLPSEVDSSESTRLELFARWFDASVTVPDEPASHVEAERLVSLGFELDPASSFSETLLVGRPDLPPGDYQLQIDVRAGGRYWLGESPCGQSRSEPATVVLD